MVSKVILGALLLGLVVNEAVGGEDKGMLQSQLDARQIESHAKFPEAMVKMMDEGNKKVAASGVVENAKQVGDRAPDFTLRNAVGKNVALSSLLKKGPVILLWYRGGWCPYCNLTLHYYQDHLAKIEASGATLVALSPEVPDKSLDTAQKNELEFEVLSDVGNTVAEEYGVVFKLPPEIHKLYEEKLNLSSYNGDESGMLPLSATYVIAPDGTITYAFLDADYTNRADPTVVLEAVKAIGK
ncbi:peroxiredoxin-like family protein [Rubellicoccus peritrichatus]|uniref:thioredoxin-dependent peroxiredoxin n=1 Tax=Rubellicoccus peritrichatus TaxID=3080537 RepID=A0AAQ3QX18_9BACT|nr:peroxiredoxin-like family protein [Puniceicoccus sp. CR14]WOO42435.1 peroxiredoxin-like family protein [Puniceicoccus sp. CR14]